MKQFLTQFGQDENGATAIEYGLMAAGIAAVIITSVGLLGERLNDTFRLIKNLMG